jgi:protease I
MRRLVRILCVFCGVLAPLTLAAAPRIAMVLAPRDFTDQEYSIARAVFDQAGAVVTVASTARGTAVGHDGTKVPVQVTTGELGAQRFDAIVVVGGTGALTFLLNDPPLLSLLRAAASSGKTVAAICVAPAVLARAGVLRNLRATCYADERVITILERNGAEYHAGSVIVSGRIVTANGPEAAKEFASRVLEVLRGASES